MKHLPYIHFPPTLTEREREKERVYFHEILKSYDDGSPGKNTNSSPPKYPPSTLKQQYTFNVLVFHWSFLVVVGSVFAPSFWE